jgi:hypothetical protein
VLVVEREPDWQGAKKRARATVLLAPGAGGFTGRTKSQALVPRAPRTARVRVACKYCDERDVSSGLSTFANRGTEGVSAVVDVRREDCDVAGQHELRVLHPLKLAGAHEATLAAISRRVGIHRRQRGVYGPIRVARQDASISPGGTLLTTSEGMPMEVRAAS